MTAQEATRQHREAMNRGDLETVNSGISDRYLGVFCLGTAGAHEIYNAQEIRDGNASADHYYRQELKKVPQWAYTDWEWGCRGDSECVVSSRIDFSLDGDVIMHALVTEVYALEGVHFTPLLLQPHCGSFSSMGDRWEQFDA